MNPLIDVAELRRLLDADPPPTLLDVRWSLGATDGEEQYLAGHLPGAAYVDLDTELAGPPGRGGRHPLPSAEVVTGAMQRAGVRSDRKVVAYDAGPGFSAARAWWVLTDAGHPDVVVLNGGLAAWRGAGLPIETGDVAAVPGDFVAVPGHRSVLDAEGVRQHLASGRDLYDVRAADRFAGLNETVDPVAGHIPGARNLPIGTLTGPDGFRPVDELAASFASAQPGDALSCGSGITASAAMLAAEASGLTGLALYAGSWSDWITDPNRPVAR